MTTNEPRKCWDVPYNIQDGNTGDVHPVKAETADLARELAREELAERYDCFDKPYDDEWAMTVGCSWQEIRIEEAVRVPDMAWVVKRLVDAVNVVTATKMELAKAPIELLRGRLNRVERMLDSIVEEARR